MSDKKQPNFNLEADQTLDVIQSNLKNEQLSDAEFRDIVGDLVAATLTRYSRVYTDNNNTALAVVPPRK